MTRASGTDEPDGWNRSNVRALRTYLGVSQRGLAEELGVRQQTVSEWETGTYRPRGASVRLLTLVAERARFPYDVSKYTTVPGEIPGEHG